MRFYSKEEFRRFMKSLIEHYQGQSQRYGDRLGTLLRTLEVQKATARDQPKEKESKGKEKQNGQEAQKFQARGWVKMGTLLVNTSDPNGAMAEVLFQLHEEAKGRLAKTTEAMKSYEELNSTTVPEASLYYLQMRNGVPERLVVDLNQNKQQTFSFSADFKLV